eukprot:3129989-Amphidinium_carterae.1
MLATAVVENPIFKIHRATATITSHFLPTGRSTWVRITEQVTSLRPPQNAIQPIPNPNTSPKTSDRINFTQTSMQLLYFGPPGSNLHKTYRAETKRNKVNATLNAVAFGANHWVFNASLGCTNL